MVAILECHNEDPREMHLYNYQRPNFTVREKVIITIKKHSAVVIKDKLHGKLYECCLILLLNALYDEMIR